MSREVNHRYLKDKNGETYFPITHINAVEGMETEGSENPFTDINDKINQMNTLITQANETIAEQQKIIKDNANAIKIFDLAMGDMVGDTGWIDYQVPPQMKNKAVKSGFPCSIKEVRVGSKMNESRFIIRSIRFNITGIKDGQQIAQLPTGFITNIQTIDIVGSARKAPVSLKLRDSGVVEAFLKEYDTSEESWIYGQYTWLE